MRFVCVSGASIVMHPAGYWITTGIVNNSDWAVVPCRTAPIRSLLASRPYHT